MRMLLTAGLISVCTAIVCAADKAGTRVIQAKRKLAKVTVPVSPTGEEITARLKKLQKQHPKLVSVEIAGRTRKGRPIEAVTVTDSQVPDDQKQHVLFVAGRHGNEESGRLQVMAILDWLVKEEGRECTRKQKIVVLPNLNPDGAAIDKYRNLDDVNPCYDIDKEKPCNETAAYLKVLNKLRPDAAVDLHACGHMGCSYDMVLYTGLRQYTNDHIITADVVQAMAAAGEKAGTPHISHPMTWSGWKGNGVALQCYTRFKAIGLLTETSESNTHSLPPEARAKVGMERLKALLAFGNRKHPQSYYPGYPFFCIVGMPNLAIVPRGRTAAARRNSRIAVWQQADKVDRLRASSPEQQDFKQISLHYSGKKVDSGCGLQFRMRGHMPVKKVTLNNKQLAISEEDGYVTWTDHCSTYLVAFIPVLAPGKYQLDIELAPLTTE